MNILFVDNFPEVIINRIENMGHKVFDCSLKPEICDKYLEDAEVIITKNRTNINREIIDKALKLRMIINGGVSIDNIDIDYAHNKGIHVMHTPEAPMISVAEFVFGLLLSAARKIYDANLSMKNGKWDKELYYGNELYGKTIGVVGFGRIGREVARRAIAFGMKIVACDKFLSESPMPGVPIVELDNLLKVSDFITLHASFDARKDKTLITEREFSLMKDNVLIINCAQGGIIDENALLLALNSKKVSFAALDVYSIEPPKSEKLIKHPNTICTPHIAAQTLEAELRMGDQIITILKGLGQN